MLLSTGYGIKNVSEVEDSSLKSDALALKFIVDYSPDTAMDHSPDTNPFLGANKNDR